MEYQTEADALAEIYNDFDYEERANEFWEQLEDKISKMGARYLFAKQAPTGTKIKCACCGTPFVKKSYQQAFCSNKGRKNCKDAYWNTCDDTRRLRAYKWQ